MYDTLTEWRNEQRKAEAALRHLKAALAIETESAARLLAL